MKDNHIVLTGNLVKEAELQFSNGGNAYLRNSIAVSKSKKVGDEWQEETYFVDFSVLDGRMAENVAESLSKGQRVTISGHIETRTVENDEGEKRTFWGVVVDDIAVSLRWQRATVVKDGQSKGGGAPAPSGGGGGDFFSPPDEAPFD